jgi:hypothetical protein
VNQNILAPTNLTVPMGVISERMETYSDLSEMSDIVTNTRWQTMVASVPNRKTKTKTK